MSVEAVEVVHHLVEAVSLSSGCFPELLFGLITSITASGIQERFEFGLKLSGLRFEVFVLPFRSCTAAALDNSCL